MPQPLSLDLLERSNDVRDRLCIFLDLASDRALALERSVQQLTMLNDRLIHEKKALEAKLETVKDT